MNIQEKLFESTADLRARATGLANIAVATARARVTAAAKRAEVLKGSLATLTVAGRELGKVARRHAVRFAKENVVIASSAGKDVTQLARTTYAALSKPAAAPRKARTTQTTRKRAVRKAA